MSEVAGDKPRNDNIAAAFASPCVCLMRDGSDRSRHARVIPIPSDVPVCRILRKDDCDCTNNISDERVYVSYQLYNVGHATCDTNSREKGRV